MRVLAWALVVLGALILIGNGFPPLSSAKDPTHTALLATKDTERPIYNAHAIGAMAFVGGIVMLLCDRREDD